MASIRVSVAGAAGRMGLEVVRCICDQSDMALVGAFDVAEVEGQDVGLLATGNPNNIRLVSSIEASLQGGPDVLIDFTRFDKAPVHLRTALDKGIAAVVGTTGIPPGVLEELGALAESHNTALFVAPNFSIGAVLMMVFARQAARYFEWADVIEMHHEKKLDAPSGTALRTADMMLEARGRPFTSPDHETLKLEGVRGGNKDGIRIHSVRMPGYLAHQQVMVGGDGEVLTLRHDSTHRTSFMSGVLLAVRKVRTLRGLVVGLEQLLEVPT